MCRLVDEAAREIDAAAAVSVSRRQPRQGNALRERAREGGGEGRERGGDEGQAEQCEGRGGPGRAARKGRVGEDRGNGRVSAGERKGVGVGGRGGEWVVRGQEDTNTRDGEADTDTRDGKAVKGVEAEQRE